MNESRFFGVACFVVTGFLLSGCAGLEVGNMVPTTGSMSSAQVDKTIAVTTVTGAQDEKFGGPAMVSDDQFKSALIEALSNSGIFQSVVADGDADLEMTAEFVAQGQGAGLNYLSALVVEYLIVDKSSRDEVWSDVFNSRHEVTVGQALSGNKRTIMAAEGSVRKNLEQVLNSLAEADFE